MKVETHFCDVDGELVLLTLEDIAYYILLGKDVYDITTRLSMESEFIDCDHYHQTKKDL